jgi:5-formyltetrahydrofolate cyclo-ligase
MKERFASQKEGHQGSFFCCRVQRQGIVTLSLHEVRSQIAQLLPGRVTGRIPKFVRSEAAAHELASTQEFLRARVVKVHPLLNANAFRECCYAAKDCPSPPRTPPSLQPRGWFRDPTPALCLCVDQKGIYQVWQPLTSLLDIPAVDFVVVASTTVCASTGARLGKGTGYGEGEWGILAQLCKV